MPSWFFFSWINVKDKKKLLNFLNRLISIRQIKAQNFDVFHPTYYDPYFLKYIGDKPFVLTVYDMIHEKFNTLFPQDDKISEFKRTLTQKRLRL